MDQTIKRNIKTYDDNIKKITSSHGDDNATDCLLDCSYFIKLYKMIAIDLSKQQPFDFNPKAI